MDKYVDEWGVHLYTGKVVHNGVHTKYAKDAIGGALVIMQLDRAKGTLSYWINGKDFGVAVTDPELCSGDIYFAVQMTYTPQYIEIIN